MKLIQAKMAEEFIKTCIYTTALPLSCADGRYFYHISGTALVSGTYYDFLGVNSDIFITFLVNQVQLQKVPLNGNLKKGSGVH